MVSNGTILLYAGIEKHRIISGIAVRGMGVYRTILC